MLCNTKTMLKVGLGLLLGTVIAYIALPDFRSMILAASPTLLFLLCPISMIFMMKMMMHDQKPQDCGTTVSDKKNEQLALANNIEPNKN